MGKKNDVTAAPAAAAAPASPATAAEKPADTTASVSAPAPKKPAAKKAVAKTPAKKASVKKPAAKKAVRKRAKYTEEDVALRAYFISQHRHQHHIHGDAHSDWVEAKRQLAAEHKKAARKKV